MINKENNQTKTESDSSMASYVGIGIIVTRDSVKSRNDNQNSAQPTVHFIDIERHRRFTDSLFSINDED